MGIFTTEYTGICTEGTETWNENLRVLREISVPAVVKFFTHSTVRAIRVSAYGSLHRQ